MRNTKLFHFVLALVLFSGLLALPAIVTAQNDLLLGAWKQTEYSFTSTDTSFTIKSPQPSIHIFGTKYYSFMYVTGNEPRPLMADDANRSTITDEQMRSIFMPFIANSGAYELDGTNLTTRPTVALWPNFMTDGSATYEYKIDGATLLLTGTSDPGTKWQYKLTRLEQYSIK